MNDKDIIKALECCVSEKDTCQNCPFQELKHYDYENEMFEIMPNGKQYDDWSCERWLNVAVLDLITRQQAEIERLKALAENGASAIDTNNRLVQKFAEIKSEAVKEFAERLKKDIFDTEYHIDRYYRRSIDNLLKEMVGDKW